MKTSAFDFLVVKVIIFSSFLILFFCGFSINIIYAAPSVSNIQDNRGDYPDSKIPKYEKFELTFSVSGLSGYNYQLPYDPIPPAGVDIGDNGVSVHAEFSKNNWQTTPKEVPGFYYQNFDFETRNNRDWFYPNGNNSWKVRFAPNETGTWRYRIRVHDRGGTTQTADGTFEVVDSTNHGFVKVSPNDARYFEFSDGTYFPGLGYNYKPNTTSISSNAIRFSQMGTNGIQLVRVWLSSLSIFGSAWNPWNAMPQDYDGYLPRSGLEANDGRFRLKLVYRGSNPNQPTCTDNCSYWKATRFIGWQSPQPSVKQNTDYLVKIKYKASNVTGPRNPSYPNYGLVAKISTNWLDNAHNAGQGSAITEYGGNTDQIEEIRGIWNSGNNNYLPFLYVTLENVVDPGTSGSAAVAYIDSIEVIEYAGGHEGENVIYKPKMNQLEYMDQRNSAAFDRLVELASDYGIYLRLVVLEKDEYLMNHIDFFGTKRTDDPVNLFYGNGTNETAVRWYQKAWFRYIQARWGYSTNIHSWELINEGDPNLVNHYILTDLMGSYMRQFENNHMVSTSNWHSFPTSLWSTYPNIDFADVHYYQPRSQTSELEDPSLATFNRSTSYGALNSGVGKPVVRGETGFVESGSDPSITDFNSDIDGLWLHDFTWGQINSGGMLESYWYVGGVDGHILNSQTGRDFQSIYGTFYRFVKDIPLNRGGYTDLVATSTNPQIRVWGQKNTSTGLAHLWVKNINHKWRNVASGTTIAPQSGTVTIPGFQANQSFILETWNTYSGQMTNSTSTQSNGSGEISISINNLTDDVAYRIGNYGEHPTNPPTLPGDVNGDDVVNIQDYQILSATFGKSIGQSGFNYRADFNEDGVVNIQDYQILSSNFGRSN